VRPKVLKSEVEYEAALAEVAARMDSEPGSAGEEAPEQFAAIAEGLGE
jgi:hypothetical protein